MANNKIYKIHKLYFDFEKEESWINEMARKGMNFMGYSFPTYKFVKGEPGEYQYKFHLLQEHASSYKSRKYIDFMQEAGIECVGTYMSWAFFRKKTGEGKLNIYTDNVSKIKYYKRVFYMVFAIATANLAIGFSNTLLMLINNRPICYISGIGFINILIFFLFLPGIIRTRKKIKHLERQGSLFD